MTSTPVIGREFELGVIAERLTAVRAGRGSALVLRSDPGMGKTVLADAAAAQAEACTVLRVTGTEGDAPLPYAALDTLVAPLLALRDRLPEGQQHALGAALALDPPAPHDRYAVPAALAGLLREGAGRAPVVMIVDDLHWVDDASRDAILFAARRTRGLRVAVLCTTRTAPGDAETARLDHHTLAPLRDAAARELLEHGAPDLTPAVTADLLRVAGGNPLALLELPRLLTAEQRAGRAPLDIARRPGRELEAAFAQEFAGLGEAPRRALTVAAAMDHGPLSWLLAALRELGLDDDALGPAERAGALRLGGPGGEDVAFRHALLRTVAYATSPDAERRAAHAALARTATDSRRRAWHLAAAASRADDDAASALDEAARSARAVGGHAEAAAAFVRAAELSARPQDRAARELEAATDLASLGRAGEALALLDAAAGRIPPDKQAAMTRLTGNLRTRRGDPHGAHRLLSAEAERHLAAGDATAATGLLLEAVVAQTMTGDRDLQRHTMAALARAAAQADGPLVTLAELTHAQDLVVTGEERRGAEQLRALLPALDGIDRVGASEAVALTVQCLIWADEDAAAAPVLERLIDELTHAGALGRLVYPLGLRATLALRRGQVATALRAAVEAVDLARDTGQETMLSFLLTVLVRVEAVHGLLDDARTHAEEALAIAAEHGVDGHAAHANAALGLAELIGDRPAWAVPALERSATLAARAGFTHPAMVPYGGDLVEALLAEGRREEAQARAAALSAGAARTGNRWIHALSARAELLLEPQERRIDERAASARAAIADLDLPLERARTELAVAVRLREARRRADAREPLRAAHDVFASHGAVAWARRTQELQHQVGEHLAPGTIAALGEEEQQIALLIGRGLTNPEIGEHLHMSRKTVERRLTTIYGKLGVRSRTELAALVGRH